MRSARRSLEETGVKNLRGRCGENVVRAGLGWMGWVGCGWVGLGLLDDWFSTKKMLNL